MAILYCILPIEECVVPIVPIRVGRRVVCTSCEANQKCERQFGVKKRGCLLESPWMKSVKHKWFKYRIYYVEKYFKHCRSEKLTVTPTRYQNPSALVLCVVFRRESIKITLLPVKFLFWLQNDYMHLVECVFDCFLFPINTHRNTDVCDCCFQVEPSVGRIEKCLVLLKRRDRFDFPTYTS